MQPVLLVVEDLHWIDAETQALLDRLVESLPTAASCCWWTPGPSTSTAGATRATTRRCRSTRWRRGAQALLDTLLGRQPDARAALKALLIERTEGDPFFLEESVWELVDAGSLAGERGPTAGAGVRDAQVPAAVHGVIASRLDRLPP